RRDAVRRAVQDGIGEIAERLSVSDARSRGAAPVLRTSMKPIRLGERLDEAGRASLRGVEPLPEPPPEDPSGIVMKPLPRRKFASRDPENVAFPPLPPDLIFKKSVLRALSRAMVWTVALFLFGLGNL